MNNQLINNAVKLAIGIDKEKARSGKAPADKVVKLSKMLFAMNDEETKRFNERIR